MSDPRPTLYLANWSSPKLHGPGRKLTIMARPRRWEHGEGTVYALVPDQGLLVAVKSGAISVADYQAAFEASLRRRQCLSELTPNYMHFGFGGIDDGRGWVRDGDTLCCACARGAECHRRWAAPYLARAGWRVILDGEEVGDV